MLGSGCQSSGGISMSMPGKTGWIEVDSVRGADRRGHDAGDQDHDPDRDRSDDLERAGDRSGRGRRRKRCDLDAGLGCDQVGDEIVELADRLGVEHLAAAVLERRRIELALGVALAHDVGVRVAIGVRRAQACAADRDW